VANLEDGEGNEWMDGKVARRYIEIGLESVIMLFYSAYLQL
jgi:hypothetical protein